MNCRHLDDLMSSAPGNFAQGLEAIPHLTKSGHYRTLISVLCEAGKPAFPPESQLTRIQARIVENLKPARPLAPSRFFLFACAIIFLCIVAIGTTLFGMNGWGALVSGKDRGFFDTRRWRDPTLLAVSMVGQMVPASRYALAPTALPIVILAALLSVLAATFHPKEEPAFVADGLVCMRNGLMYSIPAAFLFWLLVRRGAILYPTPIAAAAGGLAGLIGLNVLEITCSNFNVFHILVWHLGVVLISSRRAPYLALPSNTSNGGAAQRPLFEASPRQP